MSQTCADAGLIVATLDLLIEAVCIQHRADLITFDQDFAQMAKLSRLQVRHLKRAR